jgi:hypothetical protein
MKEIIKSFFFDSEGKFQPIYYYAFVFLHLTIILIICRIISPLGKHDKVQIPTELILGMMTYVIALIGLYSYVKHKKNRWMDK